MERKGNAHKYEQKPKRRTRTARRRPSQINGITCLFLEMTKVNELCMYSRGFQVAGGVERSGNRRLSVGKEGGAGGAENEANASPVQNELKMLL